MSTYRLNSCESGTASCDYDPADAGCVGQRSGSSSHVIRGHRSRLRLTEFLAASVGINDQVESLVLERVDVRKLRHLPGTDPFHHTVPMPCRLHVAVLRSLVLASKYIRLPGHSWRESVLGMCSRESGGHGVQSDC